jgi:hypothetical protein
MHGLRALVRVEMLQSESRLALSSGRHFSVYVQCVLSAIIKGPDQREEFSHLHEIFSEVGLLNSIRQRLVWGRLVLQ